MVTMQKTFKRSKRSLIKRFPSGVARAAGEAASTAVSKTTTNNNFRKNSIKMMEVEMGKELGHGGFCDVHEVRVHQKDCALKRLKRSDSVLRHPSAYVASAVDLVLEATILTELHHENIIKVYGMSAGPIQDSVASEQGFFVVMEKLDKTLADQMEQWKSLHNIRRTRHQHLMERLEAALGLAKALQYLHAKGVVHRDLKPHNVGFNKDGVVKLFDFGLAAKMNGKATIRGVAGTRCFMAPEMALRRSYDQSVDVYSFGLLLWEISSLQQAFDGYNERQLTSWVAKDGERPWLFMWWPRSLKNLIRECWSAESSERPTMESVVMSLEKMLETQRQ